MTNDEKWEAVLEHYGEKPFRSRVTREICRPSDRKVDFLFQEMEKFQKSIAKLIEQRDEDVKRFISWDFDKSRKFPN